MPSPRRLLLISGILMLLTAILHTIGNLAPDNDPASLKLQGTMAAFHFPFGAGMNPSMLDLLMGLILTMTVTFTGLGILNIVLAASAALPGALLRRIVWINLLWVAVFTAVSAYYRIPPPLISGIVICFPLIAALVVPNRGELPKSA